MWRDLMDEQENLATKQLVCTDRDALTAVVNRNLPSVTPAGVGIRSRKGMGTNRD